jgi:thiamine kinase-like enzyme
MEFIRGMTLSEFLTNADISTIGPIVKVFVHHFISENCFSTIPSKKTQSIFVQKAKSTYSKITSPSKIVSNAMEVVLSHDWSFYQKTSCHGDLTFENIMVVNGDVYLIDFLDSFFDSSIIDLSKMLQDLQCEWSFRNSQVDNNTIVRLLIFKELLLSSIESINPLIIKEAYYSLLLTLIRIYPYTNDEKTMAFLDNKLSIALNKVKGFEK